MEFKRGKKLFAVVNDKRIVKFAEYTIKDFDEDYLIVTLDKPYYNSDKYFYAFIELHFAETKKEAVDREIGQYEQEIAVRKQRLETLNNWLKENGYDTK